jgi:hypothetical protein
MSGHPQASATAFDRRQDPAVENGPKASHFGYMYEVADTSTIQLRQKLCGIRLDMGLAPHLPEIGDVLLDLLTSPLGAPHCDGMGALGGRGGLTLVSQP